MLLILNSERFAKKAERLLFMERHEDKWEVINKIRSVCLYKNKKQQMLV